MGLGFLGSRLEPGRDEAVAPMWDCWGVQLLLLLLLFSAALGWAQEEEEDVIEDLVEAQEEEGDVIEDPVACYLCGETVLPGQDYKVHLAAAHRLTKVRIKL